MNYMHLLRVRLDARYVHDVAKELDPALGILTLLVIECDSSIADSC